MPLCFIHEDITNIKADIIVNPTDESCEIHTNVSKAILKIAGPEMSTALSSFKKIKIGSCVSTSGFNSDYKYIFHSAVPYWCNGKENDKNLLDSCYCDAFYNAESKQCKSIVLPLLGVGYYSFPFDIAVDIAIRAANSFSSVNDSLTIIIAIADPNLFVDLQFKYPDNCVTSKNELLYFTQKSLDSKLKYKNSTLYELLLSYMSQNNMTPVQCYTAAGIDKKLFSKIKTSNRNYFPTKENILKFALALRLNVDEPQKLLNTCGYVLSDSIPKDIIYKHYITQQIYDYQIIENEINKRSL